jgi:hypothetical protein
VLAVSGTYLWCEGIPSSVMKTAANTPPARPVPVTAGVVKDHEFAISRVGLGAVQAYNNVTVIVSPFAGRTGIRLIDQGNIVHASDSADSSHNWRRSA